MFKNFFDKDAPYVGSFDYQLRLIKNNLKLDKNKNLIDLGCGDGKALRFFKKNYNINLCEGYDLNKFAIFYGRIFNKIFGYNGINLYRKNFLQVDLKKYDYVYLYLLPRQLSNIENRLFDNINDDAIIITNSFKFAKKIPFKTFKNKKNIDTIYIYKK